MQWFVSIDNLIEDEFAADQKGYSHLLEIVDVMVDRSTCEIKTKGGNILLSDSDLADDIAPVIVPPEHAQAMLTGLEAAYSFFASAEANNADGVLTEAEYEAIIDFYSPGVIHRGSNLDELKEKLFSEASLFKGITFDEIEFYRMMYTKTDHPLGETGVSEVGDGAVAFWCTARSNVRGRIAKGVVSFIRRTGPITLKKAVSISAASQTATAL